MPGLLLAFAVVLSSDFEGGNIRDVQHLGPAHLRVNVPGETDQDGRNRQANWYYFRLDGVKGKDLTIELANLAGEYNYRPNKGAVTADTPPYFSYDDEAWEPVRDFTYDANEPKLIVRLRPSSDRLWIAHVPPYTSRHLNRLRREIGGHPAFRESEIGRSLGGRPLVLWTIADPAPPPANRKVIWLMARQHSWEASTSWVAEGLVRFLLSADPLAAEIRRRAVFKILPLCDPDGVARGGVRFNGKGFDLNRNWDTPDVEKMPEIAAQRGAIAEWLKAGNALDLFLSLHNTETAEYLEGPPRGGEGRYEELGRRLARLLEERTTFAPTRPLSWAETTTTPGKPGRMNVVQGLWNDFHVPAFLSEQRVSFQPKLKRRPTTGDRLQMGVDLAKTLWFAVSS
jgi:hypothetical protein